MNPNWNDTLANAGASFDENHVLHFGDATAELAATASATIACPLTHLGLIRVTGEEASSFLHHQFTSDINHLGADAVQHSAWCSAKGRMVASFIVWREGDDYLLALAADLVEAIAKRLQMYVLRAKAKISIESGRLLIGVSGAQAEAALAAAGLSFPDIMKSAASPAGSVVRIDEGRCIVAAANEQGAVAWKALTGAARPVGVPAWQWLDIGAGLPLVTAATREQFVPQMANFERIGGVSFHKGCYPGQEIVARTQYLGKVKRHLYRLHGVSAAAAGDELFAEAIQDQACGMVVCSAPAPQGGYAALAVLMESAAGAPIHMRERGGPTVSAVPVASS